MVQKREPEDGPEYLSEDMEVVEEEDYGSDEIQEEEEDEDGEPMQKPTKKKRKMNPFIDMEAEEDDAEEEEEGGEIEGFIADEDSVVDEDRRQARVHQLQHKQLVENDDPKAYAAYIQQRFGEDDNEYEVQPEASAIDQQSLQPTNRDPRLFIVRVRKSGDERKAVLTLLQKYFALKQKGIDLHIMSAVAPGQLKGVVYVEAASASAVEHAINGLDIFNTYVGVKALKLEEMTDALKVAKKLDKLKPGDFVRLTKGKYKNDLAQVHQLIEGKENYCMIRLIPRLDIKAEKELMDNDYEEEDEENPPTSLLMNNRRRGRPPQKLFDKEEIYRSKASADMHQERDTFTGDIFDVWNNEFYRYGLLHMRTTVKSLIRGEEVNPQVDEVEKWLAAESRLRLLHKEDPSAVSAQEAQDGLNLKFISAASSTSVSGLYKGDKILVSKGEQKGLTGVIIGFNGTMCYIQSPEFPEPLSVNKKDLVKTFVAGETVKVVSGKYSGEAGSIVNVEGEFLTIFTDSTRKHIRVLVSHVADSKDINLSAAQQSGLRSSEHFELFELVSSADDNSKGVVVEVQNDAVAVLTVHNRVMKLSLRNIKKKIKDRCARAHDARGNPIAPNDSIHVISGPSKDRNGVVLHVSGPYIFFRARDETKNCGVIACPASNITAGTAAAVRCKSLLSSGSGATVAPPRGSVASVGSGGVMDSGRRRIGGRQPSNDSLLRKEVKIVKGAMKGDIGQVTYVDAKFVRVQIPSKMKIVKVAKDKVKLIGADGIVQNTGMVGGQNRLDPPRTNVKVGGGGGSSSGSCRGNTMIPTQPGPSAIRTPRDPRSLSYSNPPVSQRYGNEMSAMYSSGSMTPRHNNSSVTPGPTQNTALGFAFGSTTPRSDAFRPYTPYRNANSYSSNPYGDSVNIPTPKTPAQEDQYQPYDRPVTRTHSALGASTSVSSTQPYSSGIVEPGTPANSFVSNAPTHFTGSGVVEPGTVSNRLGLHTPGPMEAGPRTPAAGAGPSTLALRPEPASMVESHTQNVLQTSIPDEPAADTGKIGFMVLIDVVCIANEGGFQGVVKDVATDGSFVQVLMIDGPDQGQAVKLVGSKIAPVQPSSEVDPTAFEMVKVLDGKFQGKIGKLTGVQGHPEDPDGVIQFPNSEVQTLSLSLVAKCQVE